MHLINYRRADYDRSTRAAPVAENATVSVLHGRCRRSSHLQCEAHEHGRNDGVTGPAVGAVLADFIFEATTRIVTVKCVENRNASILRAAGPWEKDQAGFNHVPLGSWDPPLKWDFASGRFLRRSLEVPGHRGGSENIMRGKARDAESVSSHG